MDPRDRNPEYPTSNVTPQLHRRLFGSSSAEESEHEVHSHGLHADARMTMEPKSEDEEEEYGVAAVLRLVDASLSSATATQNPHEFALILENWETSILQIPTTSSSLEEQVEERTKRLSKLLSLYGKLLASKLTNQIHALPPSQTFEFVENVITCIVVVVFNHLYRHLVRGSSMSFRPDGPSTHIDSNIVAMEYLNCLSVLLVLVITKLPVLQSTINLVKYLVNSNSAVPTFVSIPPQHATRLARIILLATVYKNLSRLIVLGAVPRGRGSQEIEGELHVINILLEYQSDLVDDVHVASFPLAPLLATGSLFRIQESLAIISSQTSSSSDGVSVAFMNLRQQCHKFLLARTEPQSFADIVDYTPITLPEVLSPITPIEKLASVLPFILTPPESKITLTTNQYRVQSDFRDLLRLIGVNSSTATLNSIMRTILIRDSCLHSLRLPETSELLQSVVIPKLTSSLPEQLLSVILSETGFVTSPVYDLVLQRILTISYENQASASSAVRNLSTEAIDAMKTQWEDALRKKKAYSSVVAIFYRALKNAYNQGQRFGNPSEERWRIDLAQKLVIPGPLLPFVYFMDSPNTGDKRKRTRLPLLVSQGDVIVVGLWKQLQLLLSSRQYEALVPFLPDEASPKDLPAMANILTQALTNESVKRRLEEVTELDLVASATNLRPGQANPFLAVPCLMDPRCPDDTQGLFLLDSIFQKFTDVAVSLDADQRNAWIRDLVVTHCLEFGEKNLETILVKFMEDTEEVIDHVVLEINRVKGYRKLLFDKIVRTGFQRILNMDRSVSGPFFEATLKHADKKLKAWWASEMIVDGQQNELIEVCRADLKDEKVAGGLGPLAKKMREIVIPMILNKEVSGLLSMDKSWDLVLAAYFGTVPPSLDVADTFGVVLDKSQAIGTDAEQLSQFIFRVKTIINMILHMKVPRHTKKRRLPQIDHSWFIAHILEPTIDRLGQSKIASNIFGQLITNQNLIFPFHIEPKHTSFVPQNSINFILRHRNAQLALPALTTFWESLNVSPELIFQLLEAITEGSSSTQKNTKDIRGSEMSVNDLGKQWIQSLVNQALERKRNPPRPELVIEYGLSCRLPDFSVELLLQVMYDCVHKSDIEPNRVLFGWVDALIREGEDSIAHLATPRMMVGPGNVSGTDLLAQKLHSWSILVKKLLLDSSLHQRRGSGDKAANSPDTISTSCSSPRDLLLQDERLCVRTNNVMLSALRIACDVGTYETVFGGMINLVLSWIELLQRQQQQKQLQSNKVHDDRDEKKKEDDRSLLVLLSTTTVHELIVCMSSPFAEPYQNRINSAIHFLIMHGVQQDVSAENVDVTEEEDPDDEEQLQETVSNGRQNTDYVERCLVTILEQIQALLRLIMGNQPSQRGPEIHRVKTCIASHKNLIKALVKDYLGENSSIKWGHRATLISLLLRMLTEAFRNAVREDDSGFHDAEKQQHRAPLDNSIMMIVLELMTCLPVPFDDATAVSAVCFYAGGIVGQFDGFATDGSNIGILDETSQNRTEMLGYLEIILTLFHQKSPSTALEPHWDTFLRTLIIGIKSRQRGENVKQLSRVILNDLLKHIHRRRNWGLRDLIREKVEVALKESGISRLESGWVS